MFGKLWQWLDDFQRRHDPALQLRYPPTPWPPKTDEEKDWEGKLTWAGTIAFIIFLIILVFWFAS
jgi:hypothetical protein